MPGSGFTTSAHGFKWMDGTSAGAGLGHVGFSYRQGDCMLIYPGYPSYGLGLNPYNCACGAHPLPYICEYPTV